MATVLIADDSAVTRRVLGLTLRRSGYTVRVADDGSTALEVLHEEDVDLLIADLSMPGIDGLTLLRRLRADVDFMHLPVVMLTASAQEVDRLSADDEGASAFLTKPASSAELLETVDRLLEHG